MVKFIRDHKNGCRLTGLEMDKSIKGREPVVAPLDYSGSAKSVNAYLTTETDVGRGRGVIRLCKDLDGTWKAFTLFTTMQELKGYEEPLGERRAEGVEHGGMPGRLNWADRRQIQKNYSDGSQPTVVIVGEFFPTISIASAVLTSLRCWSSRIDVGRAPQDAWCQHPAYPQQQESWRQLEEEVSPTGSS